MDISDILPKKTPLEIGLGLPELPKAATAPEPFDLMRDATPTRNSY